MTTSVQNQPPSGHAQPLAYVPQLDGLRALAAIGVIIAHHGLFAGVPVLGLVGLRLGGLAVDMFFVLSGYLITGILLQCKHACENQPIGTTIRQFYIRRSLRIFPLYYAVFMAFAVVDVGDIRSASPWFLTYTVNFGKAFSDLNFAPLNHFWTLAVEEQFYLAWPLIVLLLRPRILLILCFVLAAISVLFRCAAVQYEVPYQVIQQFTYACFDPLCTGAAFSIMSFYRIGPRSFPTSCVALGVPASFLLLLFAGDDLLRSVGRLAYSAMFGAIIGHLAGGGMAF